MPAVAPPPPPLARMEGRLSCRASRSFCADLPTFSAGRFENHVGRRGAVRVLAGGVPPSRDADARLLELEEEVERAPAAAGRCASQRVCQAVAHTRPPLPRRWGIRPAAATTTTKQLQLAQRASCVPAAATTPHASSLACCGGAAVVGDDEDGCTVWAAPHQQLKRRPICALSDGDVADDELVV